MEYVDVSVYVHQTLGKCPLSSLCLVENTFVCCLFLYCVQTPVNLMTLRFLVELIKIPVVVLEVVSVRRRSGKQLLVGYADLIDNQKVMPDNLGSISFACLIYHNH